MRLIRARAKGPEVFLLEKTCEELIERLAAVMRPFQRVIDVATPADHLVRAMAGLSQQRQITRLSPLPEPANDKWNNVEGDAEELPFTPRSFDLAISALALHSVNDLPGALVQIRRLLAADGLFLGCMIGGQTLQELRAAFAEAETEIRGGASPRVAPFADLRDLGGLLQRAGFALPVTDADTFTVRYDTMFALMADLRAMGATNNLVERSRQFLRRNVVMRAADIYASRFSDADGRVRATFEILWMSGWAPHDSQQKPLQPGSAKMRLADALPVKDYDSSDG